MARSKRSLTESPLYDTVPYKAGGKRYTVFLCKRCSKAWKLADPVEAYRVKALITHFSTHDIDKAISAHVALST